MQITAPASTANLGPGFDALAMALDLAFALTDVAPTDPDDGPTWHEAESQHPASIAHRTAGGSGSLWWRSRIPPGRGLGFSAAAHVAGAALAFSQRDVDLDLSRPAILAVAAELEGHPDNAAAAVFGGIVVAAASRVVEIECSLDIEVIVWIPADASTSTKASRARLPASVPFELAVFSVARTALLVAALAAGDRQALMAATEDRLHQPTRLTGQPGAELAMQVIRSHAIAGWLSGSGPCVAGLIDRGSGDRFPRDLLPEGRTVVFPIDYLGVRLAETDA